MVRQYILPNDSDTLPWQPQFKHLPQKVLFIQPPFTQLNTPYPATAYLKGFLNTKGIASAQADIGIETILSIFSWEGLTHLFSAVERKEPEMSDNSLRILKLQSTYLKTINPVIGFLQGQDPTLANLICTRNFLPEASRFEQLADLEWAFGSIGMHDKARHLATLYLEDISDFIIDAIDPHFGFSRYAERLGRSAHSFDELHTELQYQQSFLDEIYLSLLHEHIVESEPSLIALSVPFPGNLYAAFKCAQYVKSKFPAIKLSMGGGFANTELRSLSDPRVFEFFDFITLDDGEAPMLNLLEHLDDKRPLEKLKRCFALDEFGVVTYYNGSETPDIKQRDVGVPDYEGLPLKQYLSVIEVANPMHRLWSDGRWNKLTMAHGCYWGKCTFCDISLDYIKVYESTTARVLVDRMESLIHQTGERGFHFVDEAAPPALMREVALEILKRELIVTWWTNIRFEKSFTADLCRLLAASGCIAVSGGLEVASDRLLALIDKGVTVGQVAKVTRDFTEAGIMVHAYLMYGYPTQTVQETIDSLEVVRQLYEHGVVQSGFWHQFAMTAHSPVGMDPEAFSVVAMTTEVGSFANNDLEFNDPTGVDHNMFNQGLKTSLFNYMHGICFEYELQEWFDFEIPETSIAPDYIANFLELKELHEFKANKRVVWLGAEPELYETEDPTKGILLIESQNESIEIPVKLVVGEWLLEVLPNLSPNAEARTNLGQLKALYEEAGLGKFEKFWKGKVFRELRDCGLVVV